MYSIGYDIGSSSVKAAIVDLSLGKKIGLTSYPKSELEIESLHLGWAEQNPEVWWSSLCKATTNLLHETGISSTEIKSIGISYQMHGLVLIDENQELLRPSIIWCDSRAVEIGNRALTDLGASYCFENLLNSPGNFTASKLRWVKENEPDIYRKIHKILLPGDFIAMKLTGKTNTTISGLSEGVFWDFRKNEISQKLLNYYEIRDEMIPDIVETFDVQGTLTKEAALQTGLKEGTPITYRSGDQPNNAFSLGVLNPGEIAATGGTSGVVYGISDKVNADTNSRINAFAHVNHSPSKVRIGQLLCINGAGSQYAWIRKEVASEGLSYNEMEDKAAQISVGSEGLMIHPFGNGVERMLNNLNNSASVSGLQFNIHKRAHFYRAALEGIAFAFVYGIECMKSLGVHPSKIKVGNDNLFQSEIFSSTISNLVDCSIEMIDTSGAIGAAKGSTVVIGRHSSPEEVIGDIETIKVYEPSGSRVKYDEAYSIWCTALERNLTQNKSQ